MLCCALRAACCACAVCFLPLRWSLPFIAASAAIVLRYMMPTVSLFMTQHPSFAPGVQHLCRGMCNVLLLASGEEPLPPPGLAGPGLGPPEALPPLCHDINARWLSAFVLTVGGVLLPLYLVHVVLERNMVPYMYRLLSGQTGHASSGGRGGRGRGGGGAGVTLDAVLVFVLVHAPLLWGAAMGLVVGLGSLMPSLPPP